MSQRKLLLLFFPLLSEGVYPEHLDTVDCKTADNFLSLFLHVVVTPCAPVAAPELTQPIKIMEKKNKP